MLLAKPSACRHLHSLNAASSGELQAIDKEVEVFVYVRMHI